MINLFSISGAVLVISCLILNLIILKSDRKSKLIYFLIYFNFSVGLWGFSAYFIGRATNIDESFFWWVIANVGIAFIPVFLLHFSLLFCEINKPTILRFAYIQALFFIFSSSSKLFITDLRLFHGFYYITAGPLYFLFFAFWAFFVFYGHYYLFLEYRKSSGLRKNQIKLFFIGVLLGFSGGITNFLPVFKIDFYPFGNFTIPLYCLIITYAILKFRLLDIPLIFTRAGIFVAIYSFTLGVPFAVGIFFKKDLIYILGDNWWIIPLICSTVLATVGPFFYLFVQKKAEERLLREQINYQNILRNASSGMIRIKNLDKLLDMIAHVVTKTVRIKHTSIFLFDKENGSYALRAERGIKNKVFGNSIVDFGSPLVWTLMKNREPIVMEETILKLNENFQNLALTSLVKQLSVLKASLVIPSFVENNLIGFLVLGEKRSGKMYSQDDMVVFSVLANQAALAIENAQFYDEIKQTHEQLFQAEKMATIGTMADGLSHQINNRFHALSLIAGDSLDMLKTFDFSTCNDGARQVLVDLRDALERIESNVLQGGEVVKGLLKYSRPGDTGHEAIDFRDVVNGAIDMVQYKIKLKEIDLIQDIPQDTPKIHANLIQLQEVFFNLIDNAFDAIKERQSTLKEEGYRGKIQIQVRADDQVLAVVVSDNGMGIKDLDRKKLFTPFFTTKATAKKGTGLGLYVIEKIISSHNGKISIDSTYLSGTQFNISLPIFKSAAK